jgi:hypothetical protein
MQKFWFLVGCGFLLISESFAADQITASKDDSAAKTGPCNELKLDDTQKARMKEETLKYQEGVIDIEARIAKAYLKYETIKKDPESTLSAAKAASQEATSAMSSMIQAEADFENEILFVIAKPNQRHLVHDCLMSRMKRRNAALHPPSAQPANVKQ